MVSPGERERGRGRGGEIGKKYYLPIIAQVSQQVNFLCSTPHTVTTCLQPAAVAQLGERQTEDLKVPGSIPGLGIFLSSTSTC